MVPKRLGKSFASPPPPRLRERPQVCVPALASGVRPPLVVRGGSEKVKITLLSGPRLDCALPEQTRHPVFGQLAATGLFWPGSFPRSHLSPLSPKTIFDLHQRCPLKPLAGSGPISPPRGVLSPDGHCIGSCIPDIPLRAQGCGRNPRDQRGETL